MTSDRKALLWAAIEDYAGLWEAVWELRALHPDETDDELRRRARAILLAFVADGWVELFDSDWLGDRLTLIDDKEASRRILLVDSSWERPDDAAIRFSVTPEGEEAYSHLA